MPKASGGAIMQQQQHQQQSQNPVDDVSLISFKNLLSTKIVNLETIKFMFLYLLSDYHGLIDWRTEFIIF